MVEKEVGRWSWGDSNPLPSHCERDALPDELQPHKETVFRNCIHHRNPVSTNITLPSGWFSGGFPLSL